MGYETRLLIGISQGPEELYEIIEDYEDKGLPHPYLEDENGNFAIDISVNCNNEIYDLALDCEIAITLAPIMRDKANCSRNTLSTRCSLDKRESSSLNNSP